MTALKGDTKRYSTDQFSSIPRLPWVVGGRGGGHGGQFSRDPLPFFFSTGGPREQFWYGQGCSLFDVFHPAFPLPTKASPTVQDALKNVFGEAVVACDVFEPCKYPSLDNYYQPPPHTLALRIANPIFKKKWGGGIKKTLTTVFFPVDS